MNESLEKKILVVEDNEGHIADLKAMFDRRDHSKLHLGVDYASTLDEAMALLAKQSYDGILSDVFYPTSVGGDEEPNGMKLSHYAFDNSIPIVLVTSTYHHDDKTQSVHEWAMKQNFSLVDTYKDSIGKNFPGALLSLGYAIENPDLMQISSSGYGDGESRLKLLTLEFVNNMDYLRGEGVESFARSFDYCCGKYPGLREVVDTYCANILLQD